MGILKTGAGSVLLRKEGNLLRREEVRSSGATLMMRVSGWGRITKQVLSDSSSEEIFNRNVEKSGEDEGTYIRSRRAFKSEDISLGHDYCHDAKVSVARAF